METEENKTEDNAWDFIPAAKALVVYNTPADKLQAQTNNTQEVPTPILADYTNAYGNIAPWGINNLYPQEVMTHSLKNPIIFPVIEEKADLLASNQHLIGKISYQDGKKIFTPQENPEIEKFLKASNFDEYKTKAALNFYWFGNVFPEIVLAANGNKIINLADTANKTNSETSPIATSTQIGNTLPHNTTNTPSQGRSSKKT
jgi:hypothetical protein